MGKRILCLVCCLVLFCTVLIGCSHFGADKTVSILCIGNEYSRDMVYYLRDLSKGFRDIVPAYLEAENATIRDHANRLYLHTPAYKLWKTDMETDAFRISSESISISDALTAESWDIIILHQNLISGGFPGTYNSDLAYLIDYIRSNTESKIYWNMTWTVSDDPAFPSVPSDFRSYYNGSSNNMYNALVESMNTHINGVSSTFGSRLDGWIPTGAAIYDLSGSLGSNALYANGQNLSLESGRLAAAMTMLKTLFPEFDLSKLSADTVSALLDTDKKDEQADIEDISGYSFQAEDLQIIAAAVESACTQKDSLPTAPAPEAKENAHADITPAQTAAPLRMYFPDLAVLSNGNIILGAYENVAHYPTYGTETRGGMQEGVGRLVIWQSADNGESWDYENPLLIVDEAQMEQWGMVELSNRYELLQTTSLPPTIMADPRDPNFGVVNTDVTGDGVAEEVLLLTFWVRYYTEGSRSLKGYLTYSSDNGETWAVPQELKQQSGKGCIKRGCIASFSDGQILIPYYYDSRTACLLMEFDCSENKWVLVRDSIIPNFAVTESKEFSEISLAAPDPDSDFVYAYCRENGTILQSDNRGMRWELIGNEDGLIHQPGFAVVDKDQLYVTWAIPSTSANSRDIYGKLFLPEEGWDATSALLIYTSPDTKRHDMADPSCALLADGRVLMVAYDTSYRSIVGVYIDPTDAKWQPK